MVTTCPLCRAGLLLGEQLPKVGEGLHLDRVARGIAEEHRRLLARLALEAHVGFDDELGASGCQPVGEVLPVFEPNTEKTTVVFVDDPSSKLAQRRLRYSIADTASRRLLEKEVIFREDLEMIFGKRPWDEKTYEPISPSVNGNANGSAKGVPADPQHHSGARPIPSDTDTPPATLPKAE